MREVYFKREDDITKLDLLDKIEDLEAQVLNLTHLLKFHKLLEVPLKYKKTFPDKGECPFFEVKGIKKNPKFKVSNLECHDCNWDTLKELPDKEELEAAKTITKAYGERR